MFSGLTVRVVCVMALLAPWLAATAAAPAARASTNPAGELDRIIAVINDDVITESELSTRMVQTKHQLKLEKIKLPEDDVLRRQLLEHMVTERVQLQLAERAGIRVTDAEVEQAVERIAQNNKMTLAEFRRMLAREGMNAQSHASDVRNQITIRQLIDREINQRVVISESEIATFLEARPRGTDVEYNLSHIFLPLPEAASPEAIQAARKRAEDILRQLKQGANFEQLAVTHSQGEGALNGGALGWKKAGQLPELFVETIKDMAPGSVSDAIRGPNGFHLIRLNNRRGDAPMTNVSQTHARHILLRRSEVQSLDEARTKLLNLRNRIEHGEDFATLAKANSEDPGSAAGGGDLGWVNPGQMVPEFERAMDALKPGQLSQPISSPFGLHLIQVIARRSQDISKERLEGTARQQLHARKASERYEQWLRQMRDEAYVELVDDIN